MPAAKWHDAEKRKPKVGELVWLSMHSHPSTTCPGPGQLSAAFLSGWWTGKEWRTDLLHHKFQELQPRYWRRIPLPLKHNSLPSEDK